ncbi:permease [Paenibacillaceae bacterium WGS1546]|uniref:permease n=1 Tax=Cohnella sp. WGS1546 TaxID=3366810 RepID=UPI00372D2D77
MRQPSALAAWKLNTAFVAIIGFILVVALNPGFISSLSLSHFEGLNLFKTMLMSILLEAIPFLLLGVFVSSLIQAFIPESWVRRAIPRNPILGIGAACLLGILFPVCECGMIPVVRRLMAKGMPLYAGVAFILAGPIVNPVVYAATFAAFRTRPEMVYARMGLAIAVSAVIGLVVYYFVKHNPLKTSTEGHAAHSHCEHPHPVRRGNKLDEAMKHAGGEFFDMGKYLIVGSLITACIQAFVPRSELVGIGQGEVGSHFFMMGFAYILSLCSTADAFVASSFVSTFSAGSLLTFLVFGPMLDFKGTLMLLSVFKAKFVLFLSIAVSVAVLAGALVAGKVYL